MGKENFSNHIKKFLKDYKENLEMSNNKGNSKDVESYVKNNNAKYKLDKAKNALTDMVTDNITSVDEAIDYLKNNDNETKFYSYFSAVRQVQIGREHKDALENINKKDIPFIEKKKEFDEYVNANLKDYKEDINKKQLSFLKRDIYRTIKLDSIEKVEEFLAKKLDEGIDIDKKCPDFDTLPTPIEEQKTKEKSNVEKELLDLKNDYKDNPSILKVLDDALEYSKTIEITDIQSMVSISEGAGKIASDIQMNKDLEYLKNRGVDLNDINKGNDSYDFIDRSTDIMSKHAKESLSTPLTIKNDDIIKLFNDVKSVDEKANLHPLVELRENIEKAAKEKDIDNLIKYTKSYQETDNKIKDIFSRINKMGEKDAFMINHSYSRNASVPFEYRNDYRDASIYRSIGDLIGGLKDANVSIEDFLKDPVKTSYNYYQKLVKDDTLTKFSKETSKNEIIKTILKTDSKSMALFNSQIEEVTTKLNCFNDGLDAITFLLNDPEKQIYSTQLKLLEKAVSPGLYITQSHLFQEKNYTDNLIQIIATEPKDFSIHDLYPDSIDPTTLESRKFNMNEYIKSGKTTVENVVERMTDTFKDGIDFDKEKITNSMKEMSDLILKDKDLKLNRATKSILQNFSKKTPEKIKDSTIKAFKLTKDVNANSKNNYKTANKNQEIKKLVDLKKEYKKMGFFKRLGSDGRLLNGSIKELTESLNKAYGKKEVSESLKNPEKLAKESAEPVKENPANDNKEIKVESPEIQKLNLKKSFEKELGEPQIHAKDSNSKTLQKNEPEK